MAIYFYENAATGAADAAGVFIPAEDLAGVSDGEFSDATATSIKRGKLVNGLVNKIVDYITAQTNLLGFAATKGTPTGAGAGLINVTYQLTSQYVVTWSSKAISTIPLAGSGNNANYGRIGLKSIFPNAAVIASGGDVPDEGVILPTADLQNYGGPASISAIETTNDNRDVIAAIFRMMGADTNLLNTTENQTGVTTQSVGTPTSFTPAAALFAASHPQSGLTEPLSKYSFFQQVNSITLQYLLNQDNQTFEVNAQ